MKLVCAWCGNEIPRETGIEEEGVSHGICEACRDYFFSSQGPPNFDCFLDKLAVPVIVVDDEVKIVAANNIACRQLGKRCSELNGISFGDAIECCYARLPGGCGRTVHCRSCTVRITVLDTFRTGQSHYEVPAYHDLSFYNKVRSISYLISTEKSGDYVYLKIHEVNSEECEQGKAA